MRLRKFSPDGNDIATLVCAPLALHDAALTDFGPGATRGVAPDGAVGISGTPQRQVLD
jgi:hypothetical protein